MCYLVIEATSVKVLYGFRMQKGMTQPEKHTNFLQHYIQIAVSWFKWWRRQGLLSEKFGI
jgi:hypothetical protein